MENKYFVVATDYGWGSELTRVYEFDTKEEVEAFENDLSRNETIEWIIYGKEIS